MFQPFAIAHYCITAKLGAGGMGAVYRATDTKLNREVAIKVLPAAFAEDAARLSRFEREAQVLASLNHPNIAAIYGIEQGAIIMELVEGEDLRGPVPIDTAIAYARQIAASLEAAHEKGIVHRDLKPANIRVTPDGTVKLLDFGLAKATEQSAVPNSAANPTMSPTLSVTMTQAGMILGTAAYMSPEQARGHAADQRADIWAFGAVLYEMLTGKMAFGGDSVADVLASVMKQEPDWSALPPATPRRVQTLLRRCLAKDRKQRLQAVGEARITLDDPDPEVLPLPVTRDFRWVAAACFVLALVTAVAAWRAWRPLSQPLVRWTVQPGPEFVRTGGGTSAILSPDGTRIVYIGSGSDGRRRLFTRPLDQEGASVLAGTEGASDPFFSPVGDAVGFFAGGKLRKVYLRGEGAIVLCDAPLPQGGSWGEDGNIIAALSSSGVLSRIPASGGAPQPLTRLQHELTHRWPQALPGAGAVLFTAHTAGLGFDDATIEVQSLKTGERKTLIRGGSYGRYVASGHLLYVHQRVLFAAPMDLRTLQLTGPAVPVIEGVASSNYGGAQFDLALNGTLLYGRAGSDRRTLLWLDSSGRTQPLRPGAAAYDASMEFSPDGKRLAVVLMEAGNQDVWVYDWERDVMTRLTFTAGLDAFPKWAPDGESILFSSVRHGGPQNLYWMRADGAGEAIRLTESNSVQVPGAISPDGSRVVFTEVNPQTGYDLWTVALEGADSGHPRAGKQEPLLQTPFNEGSPAISPDGRWLAYATNEAGETEVFVRPFPGPGGKWRVSTSGGANPVWSKKGRELFFKGPEGIMIVSYSADAGVFNAGRPRLWAGSKEVGLYVGLFAVAPDGKRAAVLKDEDTGKTEISQIVVVTGFVDELRRRVPARGQ